MKNHRNYQQFIFEIEEQKHQIQNHEEQLKSVCELLSTEKHRSFTINNEKSTITREFTAKIDQLENCIQQQQHQIDHLDSELKTITDKYQCVQMQNEAFSVEGKEKERQIDELKALLVRAQNESVLLKNELKHPGKICEQSNAEIVKLKEENRYLRMKLTDHQSTPTEASDVKDMDAEMEKWDRSKKQRDIVKLENMLLAEKSTVQEMQRQMTRIQQLEFNKNMRIERLQSKMEKVTLENEEIASKSKYKECKDSLVGSMFAMIAKQASAVKRMQTELSIKTDKLSKNELEIERQRRCCDQMLCSKQKRNRENLLMQRKKMCE